MLNKLNFIVRARHGLKEARYALGYRPAKLLFEHVPKCGGASIKRYLINNYPDSRIYAIDGLHVRDSLAGFEKLPEANRHNYDLVIGHGAHQLRNLCHPEIIRATILRDPVERIVSHYYYVRNCPGHYLYKYVSQGMTLSEYVSSGISAELSNNYICRFSGITADEASKNPDYAIAATYKILLMEYHIIGILEELDSAISLIAAKAGIKSRSSPDKYNASINKPLLEHIESRDIEVVRNYNKLDIKLYELIVKKLETDVHRTEHTPQ